MPLGKELQEHSQGLARNESRYSTDVSDARLLLTQRSSAARSHGEHNGSVLQRTAELSSTLTELKTATIPIAAELLRMDLRVFSTAGAHNAEQTSLSDEKPHFGCGIGRKKSDQNVKSVSAHQRLRILYFGG